MSEPYSRDDAATLFYAGCRDVLPLLVPDSVDLVLPDPDGDVLVCRCGATRAWRGRIEG